MTVNVTNGEFLHYKIEVAGANPNFTFACSDRPRIKRAADFPNHPLPVYEWDYLNHKGDVDATPIDAFTIGINGLHDRPLGQESSRDTLAFPQCSLAWHAWPARRRSATSLEALRNGLSVA